MDKKHNIIFLLAAASIFATLCGCKDSFDLDTLQNPPKLVVYCFPSDADTTYISVTNSVGVKKFTDTRKIANLADARVSYTVNGESREVKPLDNGMFYVVGSHAPGDAVDIRVEHDDFAPVTAQTTVPLPAAVELKSVRTVREYDSYWMETREFHQLLATFTDPAATADYYAVRVLLKGFDISGDSATVWPKVETLDEPLLHGISDIDEDFGYENNFYGDLCIFSDQDINGQTYTLHLDIETKAGLPDYKLDWQYQVVLFKISPEYYRFLKSINDVENNELAQGGFAQLTPTFTNIHSGAGVLGAYTRAFSTWCRLQNENR
ncbi:MAG: DUF4249 domain-containing protein [Prevotella sp.]|nr:DUF4249 domain-containing protein [Prevotella sp.]